MALPQELRAVMRDPEAALIILRNQYLERQVETSRRRCQHQGSSRFRADEDQQFRCRHFHGNFLRLPAVIGSLKQLVQPAPLPHLRRF